MDGCVQWLCPHHHDVDTGIHAVDRGLRRGDDAPMALDEREPFAPTTLRTRLAVGVCAGLGSMTATALSILGTPEWGEWESPLRLWATWGLAGAMVGGVLLAALGPALARLLPHKSLWAGPASAIAICFVPLGLLFAGELVAPSQWGVGWGSCAAFALLAGGGICGMMAAERLRHASPRPHPVLGWALPIIVAVGIGSAGRLGVEASPTSLLMVDAPSSAPTPSPDGTRVAQVLHSESLHAGWRTALESTLVAVWRLEVTDRDRVRRTVQLDHDWDDGIDAWREARFSVAWAPNGNSLTVKGGLRDRTLTVFDLGHSLVACDGVITISGTPEPLSASLSDQLLQLGRPAEEVARLRRLVVRGGRPVVQGDPRFVRSCRPAFLCDDPNVLIEVPADHSSDPTWDDSIVARGPILVSANARTPRTVASQQWILIVDTDRRGARFFGEDILVLAPPEFDLDANRPPTVVPSKK